MAVDKSVAIQEEQEKKVADEVLARVTELNKKGELRIPHGYSPENALKSAQLILQETVDKDKKPVLQSCSRASIANTLLDMIIQGLSPAKKQCYFVAYGNKLQLMRSYMGTVAVTKRLSGVKDIKAYCIYEGDEFETEFDVDTATLRIKKFNPKFENVDISKIKGAFAVIIGEDGPVHLEIMGIGQIKKSWGQGAAKGNSGAHNNFTDEMAKKTVINRACKMYANTSDDSDLLIGSFNNTDKEEDFKNSIKNSDVKVEISNNANKEIIDIAPEDVEVNEPTELPGQISIQEGPGF